MEFPKERPRDGTIIGVYIFIPQQGFRTGGRGGGVRLGAEPGDRDRVMGRAGRGATATERTERQDSPAIPFLL